MKDAFTITSQEYCAIAANKSIVVPPTKAGQIPVAELQASTGNYVYAPKTNPTNDLLPTDVGQALKVAAVDQDGVTLAGTNAVLLDDALSKFFNQPGLLTAPSVAIASSNTIQIGPIQPIFAVGDKPHLFSFPGQTVTDPFALSNNADDDISYITIDTNGIYSITKTPPSPVVNSPFSVYLFEVLHPNGTGIKSIRPIYNEYGYNATKLREIGESIGTTPNNFIFTSTTTSGTINQVSTNASIRGYSINTISSTNKDQVNFPAATPITCEYFSYNPADAVASFTDFRKTYKIDNPLNNSSTALPANQNGIIVILGSITGKYLVMAPQKAYASVAAAEEERLTYLATLRLPAEFKSFYTVLATTIISGNAAAGLVAEIKLVSAVGLGGGALVAPVTLPSPVGIPNDRVVVANTTLGAYTLVDDKVLDLSTAKEGDVLYVKSGRIEAGELPLIFPRPTGYFYDRKTYSVQLVGGVPKVEIGDVGYIRVKSSVIGGYTTTIYLELLQPKKFSFIGAVLEGRVRYNGYRFADSWGAFPSGTVNAPILYFRLPNRTIIQDTTQLTVSFTVK